jgi:regulator of sirC expression with transglutaminase-like and TPR domain
VSIRSRKTFQQLVTLPDNAIPLAEAALLMACEEYPQLDLRPYIETLDRMAAEAQQMIRLTDSPITAIEKINNVLFDQFGFRGNSEDYYDPRNSFFNDVLDRRLGIPITLSTLYLEVSRRLKFPIVGVGMPGHFVVKYITRNEELFLDPFHRGELLSRDDCRERIKEMYGGSIAFSERLLERVTNRQILARMLNNLKAIYLKAEAFDKALNVVDMMMMTEPDDIEQFRDRGLLRLQLRQFAAAKQDLEYYVRHAPESEDRAKIEDHIKELRRIQAMMN